MHNLQRPKPISGDSLCTSMRLLSDLKDDNDVKSILCKAIVTDPVTGFEEKIAPHHFVCRYKFLPKIGGGNLQDLKVVERASFVSVGDPFVLFPKIEPEETPEKFNPGEEGDEQTGEQVSEDGAEMMIRVGDKFQAEIPPLIASPDAVRTSNDEPQRVRLKDAVGMYLEAAKEKLLQIHSLVWVDPTKDSVHEKPQLAVLKDLQSDHLH